MRKYLGTARVRKNSGKPGVFMPFGREHESAVEAEKCRKSFRYFIAKFWDTVNPSIPYIDSPHIHAVADHLQAVTENQIRKLAICIPPGHAKSLLASVLWPAWEWSHSPFIQSLFLSHDPRLAIRDSGRCRMVIESEEYQSVFDPDWTFRPDQNEKSYYVNTKLGSRYSFGYYSHLILGWRGDKSVIDDPLSMKNRFNNLVKSECTDILDTTLTSRVNDRTRAKTVIIMQRLADNDLVGHVSNKTGWEILKMSTEFHKEKRYHTSIGWTDWRKDEGELLFPQLFPQSEIDLIKSEELTKNDYSAQHDQEPVPEGGARFRSQFFGRWEYTDEKCQFIKLTNALTNNTDIVPLGTLSFFVSVDSAVGEKKTNDYTVYLIWGKLRDGRLILMDRHKERMTEPMSINYAKSIVRNVRYAGRPVSYFAVEDNGIGRPLIQNLQQASIPVVPVNVHTDKEAMSTSAIVQYENGRMHHPVNAHWLIDFEKCLTDFPFGNHDDDASSVSIGAESLMMVGPGNVKSGQTVVPERKSGADLVNTNVGRMDEHESERTSIRPNSRGIMGIGGR